MNERTDPHCLTDEVLYPLLYGAGWRRLVVLGDSVAEGAGDLDDPPGYPRQPWADRLAAVLTAHNPALAYLNLGKYGAFADEVKHLQLSAALAFEPGLTVVACGGNDMLHRTFDPGAVEAVLDSIVGALRGDVVTMGLFDISRSPALSPERAAALRPRLAALASLTRSVADRNGAWHVDLANHPASADASIYSSDGIHVNARGHAIAATETLRLLGGILG
ncbi:GDSL family lipase [Prauserella marina]|uniref:Lysophospholipase L1 n=1 Tax=Prauserella marina TaxID=530584 RepID=A0A222VWR2_9PSEU|nr:SGNH/GDSL hydrolase family protein [Prauserella marina]ASR38143.1 GDSL family lipase [Prauserella marina]PWV78690.1 lysophospholipase L1-like esterase [Prauserella marina]SDC91598.1 Lysophospholipase L1 [Prauserella marina]